MVRTEAMQQHLDKYLVGIEMAKANEVNRSDMKHVKQNECKNIRLQLHPTRKQETRSVTRVVIDALCEHRIMTVEGLCAITGYSDKAIRLRLKLMHDPDVEFVRRVKRFYYIATPRLLESVNKDYFEDIYDRS